MGHPLATLGVALAVMTALWPLSLALKDVSIIDIMWAPGFAILGWVLVCWGEGTGARGWLVAILVTLWATRLGTHLLFRRLKSGKEDRRYAAMREEYGARFPVVSLFVVFWLQAALLWTVSWPLQTAIGSRSPLVPLDFVGIALALAGIAIEAVADAQLTAFRTAANHDGRVLDSGLWRWSRHPNYFGDFLMWWGLFLVGLAGDDPWWTIASPVVMSALLIRFSGAGLMERTIPDRRPQYRAYIERTSAFFPWPPSRRSR